MSKKRATKIILSFAIAHAVVAGLLAQTVMGDAIILTPLTIIMVLSLSRGSKKPSEWRAAATVVAKAFGTVAGTYLASKLISWIPVWGNALNATVTFTITQAIGWIAYHYFHNE